MSPRLGVQMVPWSSKFRNKDTILLVFHDEMRSFLVKLFNNQDGVTSIVQLCRYRKRFLVPNLQGVSIKKDQALNKSFQSFYVILQ